MHQQINKQYSQKDLIAMITHGIQKKKIQIFLTELNHKVMTIKNYATKQPEQILRKGNKINRVIIVASEKRPYNHS